MPPTIEEAIAAAQETLETPVTETPETPETPATETAPETPVTPPVSEPDQKTKDALLLFDALNDPTQQAGIIEEIAKKVGLEIKKKEVTPATATATIMERMKAKVGNTSLHFILEELTPAIEELVKEQLSPLSTQFEENKRASLTEATNREFVAAESKLKTEFKDFANLETEMLAIAKRLAPTPGTKVEDYMRDLYALATQNKAAGKTVAEVVNRINKNALEAKPSASVEVSGTVRKGSALPTIEEAIAAALKGERLT